jgi:hypothetical protein
VDAAGVRGRLLFVSGGVSTGVVAGTVVVVRLPLAVGK